jgi:hypothetical protein
MLPDSLRGAARHTNTTTNNDDDDEDDDDEEDDEEDDDDNDDERDRPQWSVSTEKIYIDVGTITVNIYSSATT